MNLTEIIDAWITALNPTAEEKSKSIERAIICGTCPKLKDTSLLGTKYKKCSECGCPISKKIFSSEFNPCPLKKWESVDSKYMPAQKNTKTIW